MKHGFKDNIVSIYFIGIGGISMSALAKYMLSLNKKVGGSDVQPSAVTQELKAMGAVVDGGTAGISKYDTIVYTDAVKRDNSQLKQAKALNKKIYSRSKFLQLISGNFKSVTAICGCHGKTTCTAMLANIYFFAERKFMAHIGGRDINLTNFYYNGNDSLITEACEYKKNFLDLKPDIAVVLNTDFDHMECYKSDAELKECYLKFSSRASVAVCRYGDVCPRGAVTFGYERQADFSADKIRCGKNGISFDLVIYGKNCGRVKVNCFGRHNVLNALAASAAATAAGICFDDIKAGLENFNGVERRMEKIGVYNNVVCIADYAHHPHEIAATYKTVKSLTKGKVFTVFQPHTYSRTKNLFNEFVAELTKIDCLLIYRTFAAREYYDDEGSALTLSAAVAKASYGETPADIANFIGRAGEGDIILFLGAGDIYFIAKQIING